MKSNSKSGLRIRQVLILALTAVVLTTTVKLFVPTSKKEEIADNTIQQEVATVYKREIDTTSRSSNERKEEIKYKSINEIKISKDMDLTIRCGISKEDFKNLMTNLKKDTSGFFARNSDIIYDLCEKYELNEIFFCGLIAGESGWNISKQHRTAHNYISMMSKGNLIKFSSEQKGLEAAAKLLHNKYLTESGVYYNGKTLASMQKIFCPNSSKWVGLVYDCMEQII